MQIFVGPFRLFELACLLLSTLVCNAHVHAADTPLKPVKIVLVGDSTVTDAAGWGTGLAALMKPEATVVNHARGGASTKSYTAAGLWKKKKKKKPDYVFIQFGHNDQPGKGPERETDPATTYPEFLAKFVDEARAAGAKPILVTSLARRVFDGDKLRTDLEPYAEAVRKVGKEKTVPVLDLHVVSKAAVEKLGPKESEAWAPAPVKQPTGEPKPDRTHLSADGAKVVGKLVAEELKKNAPELAA